jgi:hypothetical protein
VHTRITQELIESLQIHSWHMTSVSERLSHAAEEFAHTHRTPMFDVRTAVDVLATGTYSMFPNLNVRALLPPTETDVENEAETERHLDFLIRSQLLNTKVPSVFTSVEISQGKLTLICDAEFELVLSMKLEVPGRPWKVEKIRILIKADNTDEPTTDTLVRMIPREDAWMNEPIPCRRTCYHVHESHSHSHTHTHTHTP